MRIAIVYDSKTGTTARAAQAMAAAAERAGHECVVEPVSKADPRRVAQADAVCVGSWTQGLFFVLQHATPATMRFIESLGALGGKPAAVFCTYKTSSGALLDRMAQRLEQRGASVTGRFRWRGTSIGSEFDAWVRSLAAPVRKST